MDVVSREVLYMPIPCISEPEEIKDLSDLISRLLENYSKNSQSVYRDGSIISTTEINYDVKKAKGIIDRIDIVLGSSIGLSNVELDFIINYDVKYRLGK